MLHANAIQIYVLRKFRILGLANETNVMSRDWKDWIPYPFKSLNDPEYIKAREECFIKNGNGWWWGDGWWNGNSETPMERQRRYRKQRGE